jgi:hypothetical protein
MAEIDGNLDPCPWGDAVVDLSHVALTANQKVWLGKQLAMKRIRLRHLARKYRLSKNQLSKYRRLVLNGKAPRAGPGRPSILDGQGVTDLLGLMTNESAPSNKIFKSNLSTVERETKIRRCEVISDDDDLPKLAHTTFYRYIGKVRNLLQANQSLQTNDQPSLGQQNNCTIM